MINNIKYIDDKKIIDNIINERKFRRYKLFN